MTIGQLIECLIGKVGAIRGNEADATPFNYPDIEMIKDELEKLGYERNGNEDLYNGMSGKKMKTAIFIGPTYYLRLKHMVSDKIHCLTMDHEVLTDNGWKFYDKITMDDKIATLKDDELVYDKPLKLLHYPDYEGELYHIESQQIDLNVTTNHRMLVSFCCTRKNIWSDYELHKAEDIKGKHVKYKKDATWSAKDYQFVLPSITDGNNVTKDSIKFDMNLWLTFFGFWIAEGWTNSCKDKRWENIVSYRVQISQKKEKTKAMIIDIIKKMGYTPCVVNDEITISDKQLYEYMKQWSKGDPFKTLPDWVWKLSSTQCVTLIESMILGDGSVIRKETNKNCCYSTSSIQLADEFTRLCLHAGWSANKYLYHEKGKSSVFEGKTITHTYNLWRLEIVKDKNKPSINHSHVSKQNAQIEEITKYKGPVFCLQVPSEIFYVRRNGKPVWTGNSRARGPRTLLTRRTVALKQLKIC
jgi:replicative DNA helicase Mcm